MAETMFGHLAARNGKVVERLRLGGSVTLDTADRIRRFMAAYDPKHPPRRRHDAA